MAMHSGDDYASGSGNNDNDELLKRFLLVPEMFSDSSVKKPIYINRFGCDICDHKAATNQDLARHHLTHSGVKPFSCDL